MKRGKNFFGILLLIMSLMFIGCNDKAKAESDKKIMDKLTAIENKLNAIEGKVNAMDAAQKEMMKLFKKPSKPSIDYNKVHNIPIGKSPIRGKKEASVTIVEFSDFQCPYCSRLQSTIEEVLKAYPNDVKLVFKDFPLSFHKQAMNAARAAHAAGEQGKYWEMHDIIFENYNKLTDASYATYAESLKLDIAKFKADFSSKKYDAQIQSDMNLGRKVGVSGTPSLFLNGKRMKNRSVDAFKSAIDGYLKK